MKFHGVSIPIEDSVVVPPEPGWGPTAVVNFMNDYAHRLALPLTSHLTTRAGMQPAWVLQLCLRRPEEQHSVRSLLQGPCRPASKPITAYSPACRRPFRFPATAVLAHGLPANGICRQDDGNEVRLLQQGPRWCGSHATIRCTTGDGLHHDNDRPFGLAGTLQRPPHLLAAL